VQFDTTEHSYKLKEAEADLAEAEQQVAKAEAEAQATEEENSYSLLKARSDVVQAELECRKNRIVSTIAARQNDLALQNARDHLAQLEKDLASRKETSRAGIAIQEALRNKSRMQAGIARRNIQNMTVSAHRNGYVFIRQNPNTNFYFRGMMLPQFKTGDAVNPGMAVAQIPDLNNWELAANIAELDRGHLAPGQAAEIHIIAVPLRPFHGHIKDMGGTSGPPWDRHFECRISLDDPSPELRPGMNSRLLITTETMRGVLWIPAHAIFESDGRTFVYVPSGAGFAPRDVKIVRRSESQAVISGLNRGQVIALASPEQDAKQEKASRGGALGALPK
jgi:multidrug efflux pump subunit AcrA (membrane-fusion protein)